MNKYFLLILLVLAPILTQTNASWGGDKVKLKDIEVLTLRHGQYTAGRRSAGVPQLSCVGGSAGCGAFVPQVVQCYNRGSDGIDVQWECKTDMDNVYRFGKVEVTCEGYDYPDDPYVLKGSCGLEYTLDLTKEGMSQQGSQQHNYYGSGQQSQQSGYGWNIPPPVQKGSNAITNIACGIVLVIIVYAIYKTCIAPNGRANRQYSTTNDDYPSGGGGPRPSAPPPPGFNPSFYPNSGDDSFGDSCNAGARRQAPAAGGFWTGAATGGLLGYLFGARNNTGNRGYGYTGNTYYSQPRPSTSWGFGGGSSSSGFSSGGTSSSSSSGTRTASGFGGTRRR